ncbi:hypothetical protein [Streptomyces sp. NPDC001933]|uniref:hypothetical protein n=1 Tax=Streptomyces sp. NPDC001933 TaxID=3364626 RepID=UPI00367BC235
MRGLELTPAGDVFCLGAVLAYAATGRLLFGATETGLNTPMLTATACVHTPPNTSALTAAFSLSTRAAS